MTAKIAFTINGSNLSSQATISTGVTIYSREASSQREYYLVNLGNFLAARLANVLDELGKYNPKAIHPIVSIFEPYMETTSGMDFSFPPTSSRKVIVEITRRGKVEPTIYFDE